MLFMIVLGCCLCVGGHGVRDTTEAQPRSQTKGHHDRAEVLLVTIFNLPSLSFSLALFPFCFMHLFIRFTHSCVILFMIVLGLLCVSRDKA